MAGAEVVFRLADAHHELTGVRLWQELGLPAEQLEFKPVAGGWELRLPRPTVHPIEYLFLQCDADGAESAITDPTNPLVVTGPFGARSVLTLPGYTAPSWLDLQPVPSRLGELVATTAVGDVAVQVWAPAYARPREPLPLLLYHDGPEFAGYAELTQYAGAMIATGALPPFRVALLSPGDDRDRRYAVNEDYAAALTHAVLPQICDAHPSTRPVVAGASLGALAALHAEWRHPGSFAGLFLQSGSFFTLDTDPQEAGFGRFDPVSAFVAAVLSASRTPSTPAYGITSGSAENVHNNRVTAAHLSRLGCEVTYAESPDVHSYTAWRDVLDPHLTALLHRVWGQGYEA